MEIVVHDLANIKVRSGSDPNVWYDVNATTGECGCLGFQHRGGCRHLKNVAQELREMGLMDEMPQHTPEQETSVELPADMPVLYTASYASQDALASGAVVPVQTSLGKPKYPIRYELAEEFKLMQPDYAMLKMESDEFRQAYRNKLNRIGARKQADVLVKIGKRSPGLPLALLCFEATHGPNASFCHRHIWAAWWEEATGVRVPELDDYGELLHWSELEVYQEGARANDGRGDDCEQQGLF